MSARAGQDRLDHLADEPRVVLVVGVDHHDRVGAVGQGARVARLLARAVAAVRRVASTSRPCASATAVVSSRHASSISSARSAASHRHLLDDVGDRARRLVGGQDDVHRRAARRARAASGSAGAGPAMRWARMTRSSPSERLSGAPAASGARRVSGPPRGPSRSARPPTQRRAANVRTNGHVVGDDEAGGGDQLAQRAARQQDGVRGQVAPPARGRRARAVADDGSGVTTHSTPPGRSSAAQRSIAVDRVVEVLEDVGEHDDVEARRVAVVPAKSSSGELADVEAERVAGVRAASRARARGRPSRSRARAPRRAAARGRSRRRAAARSGRCGRSRSSSAVPVARRPASSAR